MSPRLALLLSAVTVFGCARTPAVSAPTSQTDGSPLCDGLTQRFVGLPAVMANDAGTDDGEIAPLAGSWWIRRCATERRGTQLVLRLEGPGWYWVNASEGGIRVEQQVPFELSTAVTGNFQVGSKAGLASLWFKPTTEPQVTVDASKDLDLHGTNAWGSVLRRVPLVPVRALVADSLSRQASAAIRERLRAGATATFELSTGQSDVAIGQLAPGKKPQHPFDDGLSWLVNDRLLLPPAAAQVLGPLDAASELYLDVRVERGPGVTYRAVCTEDMQASLNAVMHGTPEQIAASVLVTSGDVTGAGSHSRRLSVHRCAFYMIVSTAKPATTLAAIRLRT